MNRNDIIAIGLWFFFIVTVTGLMGVGVIANNRDNQRREEQLRQERIASRYVKLSDNITRVCDGPRAIYQLRGQWTTETTIIENDPVCGGGK